MQVPIEYFRVPEYVASTPLAKFLTDLANFDPTFPSDGAK